MVFQWVPSPGPVFGKRSRARSQAVPGPRRHLGGARLQAAAPGAGRPTAAAEDATGRHPRQQLGGPGRWSPTKRGLLLCSACFGLQSQPKAHSWPFSEHHLVTFCSLDGTQAPPFDPVDDWCRFHFARTGRAPLPSLRGEARPVPRLVGRRAARAGACEGRHSRS